MRDTNNNPKQNQKIKLIKETEKVIGEISNCTLTNTNIGANFAFCFILKRNNIWIIRNKMNLAKTNKVPITYPSSWTILWFSFSPNEKFFSFFKNETADVPAPIPLPNKVALEISGKK